MKAVGQAKRRQQFLESVLSAPVLEQELFFVFDRYGVSVILAVKPGTDGQVNAALFCLDDWQEGLFQCWGRTYGAAIDFQSDFRPRAAIFKPALKEVCRLRVARGLEIRRRAHALIPPEYERWRHLLIPLDMPVTGPLYVCPDCGSPLPSDVEATILSSVGKAVTCYMVCEECKRLGRRGLSPETAAIKHRLMMEIFEEMESFSLNVEGRRAGLHMAMPGQVQRDGIRLCLEKGEEPAFAASLALETWLHRAAGPNDTIQDEHIRQALEEIHRSRLSHEPLPTSGEEVQFVRDAAQEGLSAFASVCAGLLSAPEREAAVTAAIRRVLESIEAHRSDLNPRSYIEFVSPYMT